jgi:ethanolamine ammonia-lyase small subunit
VSETPPVNVVKNPLAWLRRFTPARIALGRAGDSLPTAALLDFGIAHAMARDAVHEPLDLASIEQQLKSAGLQPFCVRSVATNRAAYLRRPDQGRILDESSRKQLSALQLTDKPDAVFVIGDGLSAIAPTRYAVPVISAVLPFIADWRIAPVIIAEQARVALGDEIGQLLSTEMVITLIGERPGLSSPDSLGIYLTFDPKVGRTDAERNCISNIRSEGMSVERAARTLYYLMVNSRRLRLSGVALKDESDTAQAELPGEASSSSHSRIHVQ